MGSSLENAIKVTVFLADVKTEKNAMNEVYAEFFGEAKPARTTIIVAALPRAGMRVEIDAIAYVG